MSYYRLYLLNDRNGIARFVEMVHETDDEALAEVARHRDGCAAELWNRARLVARLAADGSFAPSAAPAE